MGAYCQKRCDIMLRIFKNEKEGRNELKKIGVHDDGIDIMSPKLYQINIKFENIHPQDALILKQEMLSIGGDAAISEKALPPTSSKTDVLIMGSTKHMVMIKDKIMRQYCRLNNIGEEIEEIIDNIGRKHEMKIGNKNFKFGSKTHIMGILNVTPDSFHDGGQYINIEKAIERAKQIEREGADILDIGGESTRPFAEPVNMKEEMKRVIPALDMIKDEVKIPISIDTYKPEIAEKAIEKGANMVNDIMALQQQGMAEIVKEYDVPVCLMHMKGVPRTMQKNPYYYNTMDEIYRFLKKQIIFAKEKKIEENKIIIDPGIGFGKRTGNGIEDNCNIIAHLMQLKSLGKPILVGISHKSFISNVLNLKNEERFEGNLGSEAIAIANGADILRCHDITSSKKLATIVDKIVRT